MDEIEEVRKLRELPADQAPQGRPSTHASYAVPKDPENRGTLSFACPNCSTILIREMSEAYTKVAPPIYCRRCEVWLTPAQSK